VKVERHYYLLQGAGASCYLWAMEWLVTLKGMPETAIDFWKYFGDQKIFAIHGQMGAGKTTFIQALCQAKQVTTIIQSPTFSIINEYDSPQGKIYHLDLYRLNDEEEAFLAGVEDCLNSGEICLVEWPEKARGIFPPQAVDIYITELNSETRKIHSGPTP